MKLTTKGRYAISALIDVAMHNSSSVSLKDISDRQSISLSYLEQLFCKLKNKGLVKSRRGPGGGYILVNNPSDISLYEIVTAVDENIDQTQCGGSMNCRKDKPCSTHHVWTGLNTIIDDYMKKISIQDVISNNFTKEIIDVRGNKEYVN